MSGTHLKWIAAAVVALLVLWGAARFFPSGGGGAAAHGFRLAPVPADSADTITITAPPHTIVVRRAAAGGWTVNDFPAAGDAVGELFAALADSAAPELVAQSAASFERLGVDSMAARRLRVTRGGETLVDVLVSERGPDFQSAYVRVPGDSNVYAVAGRLAAVARRTQDDWRDKTVATVIPDSVAAIELERGGRRSVIRRRDGAWHLATGTGTDTTAVRRVVERYRQVNASGFPSEAQLDSIFRGRVERRATLRDARGAALVSLEFDSTEGGFWARRPGAGRAGVYRLNTWDVDELVPADSALRIK